MLDIKSNFFTSAKPAPTMPEIMFANDPKYRAAFGAWCYDNFDELATEYKANGHFLNLSELQDIFSDRP